MTTPEVQPYGENVIPIILVDDKEHTQTSPFCWDSACPCHEDREAIALVYEDVQNGLLTPEEATNLINGKTL